MCLERQNRKEAELAQILAKGAPAIAPSLRSPSPIEGVPSVDDVDVGLMVFGAQGERIPTDANLSNGQRVYVLRKDRQWVWPTHLPGHRVQLTSAEDATMRAPSGKVIELETVEGTPRLLYIHNFMDAEEADALRDHVLTITDPELKLKRSGVGADGSDEHGFGETSSVRTSENAFDSESPVAERVIRRAFGVLRVPYRKVLEDGLQIVHYGVGKAYIPHHDYFPILEPGQELEQPHNFDPARHGSNRFATVFLYINNVKEGGQTVFPSLETSYCKREGANCTRPGEMEFVDLETGVSDDAELQKNNRTWEARMIDQCYSRRAVHPTKGAAVIFYSQTPNGTLDPHSLHGGCPVISGEKWGANLWVWNGPRYGMTHILEKDDWVQDGYVYQAPLGSHKGNDGRPEGSVKLDFANKLNRIVRMYYVVDGDASHYGDIEPQGKLGSFTYPGHAWEARIISKDGKELTVKELVVNDHLGKNQVMTIQHRAGITDM